MLKNKIILVTGGTGSFGKTFITELLLHHNPKVIRIFSRDELKQWQMEQEFRSMPQSEKLRFFIGDVRDKERLLRAMQNVDFVVHAAALKQVPACEYNPIEAIKTNVMGAINVIDAALDCHVDRVVALSTDKASQPINLYGATKLCSDKLFIQANNYSGSTRTRFSVVRYGNVMGSRGSIVPLFFEQAKKGELTITDKKMTRFWINLEEAVKFVLDAFDIMQGGELFVPKIPSIRITDLAKAIAPKAKIKIVGIRPGEKLHESLICSDESLYTFDLGERYMIEPSSVGTWDSKYPKYKTIKKVNADFSYTSDKNTDFMSVPDIRKKLSKWFELYS